MRPDQTISDPLTTPSDDIESKATDLTESSPDADAVDALPNEEKLPIPFEQAGVYITDDDITINVSSSTGLRKTDFSDNLYVEDGSPKRTLSRIPRSPMARRRASVDSEPPTTGLPLISRKVPVYRSIRKQSPTVSNTGTTTPTTTIPTIDAAASKDSNINTWSGKSMNKKRPSFGNETFQTTTNTIKNTPVSTINAFQRNSDARASYNLYDQNGRRIKSQSTTSSPTKHNASPLAQQILEAAENAKNDAQMLEKMKLLLNKYTTPNKKTNGIAASTGTASTQVYEDFTTAWVNSNGSLDRVSNCCSPPKIHSKRSSAASSIESTQSRSENIIPSQRRDRGISRIPGPIRQNTELY